MDHAIEGLKIEEDRRQDKETSLDHDTCAWQYKVNRKTPHDYSKRKWFYQEIEACPAEDADLYFDVDKVWVWEWGGVNWSVDPQPEIKIGDTVEGHKVVGIDVEQKDKAWFFKYFVEEI